MSTFDFDTYLSPFTFRYGSEKMRQIWSEIYKRKLWRKIWVALATAQQEEGLITKEELDDLIKHQDSVDIEKAHEVEKEIGHDLMAEIKVFASQAKIGGGKIHLGATSMDIEDNADTMRYQESLTIIEKELRDLLNSFADKIETYKNTVCMGYTHLQPAEPTTLGYRFSFYAQDLLFDLKLLKFVQTNLKGKGLKGAVGTSASYTGLLQQNRHSGPLRPPSREAGQSSSEASLSRIDSGGADASQNDKSEQMEKDVMETLGIEAVTISSQTGPRKLEFFVGMLLSSIAQTLYKFAFDVRLMQSPGFGEWQEPFGKKQVGSSAMPFKRNPVKSEQICSLARLVFHLSEVSKDNAAHMLLERTLDDSANRRIYLPETFLAVDTILISANAILKDLQINQKQIERNLALHGPFAATERVLIEAVKKGANRQEMHEVLRELSMQAWHGMQNGEENPLTKLLINDKRIMQFLGAAEIKKLLDPKAHIGLAAFYCEKLLKDLHE